MEEILILVLKDVGINEKNWINLFITISDKITMIG